MNTKFELVTIEKPDRTYKSLFTDWDKAQIFIQNLKKSYSKHFQTNIETIDDLLKYDIIINCETIVLNEEFLPEEIE